MHRGKFYWRCQRSRSITTDGGSKNEKCNFKISALKDTWFEKTRLNMAQHLLIVRLYLEMNYDMAQIATICKLNKNTVTENTRFIREALLDYFLKNKVTIGGPHRVVEIDEAKFKGGNITEEG